MNIIEIHSLGDDSVTETVAQHEEVQSNVDPQQSSPASTAQTPGFAKTRQVSGKALATPAVRKMAMENNVSQHSKGLNFSVVEISRSIMESAAGTSEVQPPVLNVF
jgi:pyruvate/2-oxoglutarate dehydrogenase complex dihydrolipoamide acyltransferase (E2) component